MSADRIHINKAFPDWLRNGGPARRVPPRGLLARLKIAVDTFNM